MTMTRLAGAAIIALNGDRQRGRRVRRRRRSAGLHAAGEAVGAVDHDQRDRQGRLRDARARETATVSFPREYGDYNGASVTIDATSAAAAGRV